MKAMDLLKKNIESTGRPVDQVLASSGYFLNACICAMIDELVEEKVSELKERISRLQENVNNRFNQ